MSIELPNEQSVKTFDNSDLSFENEIEPLKNIDISTYSKNLKQNWGHTTETVNSCDKKADRDSYTHSLLHIETGSLQRKTVCHKKAVCNKKAVCYNFPRVHRLLRRGNYALARRQKFG